MPEYAKIRHCYNCGTLLLCFDVDLYLKNPMKNKKDYISGYGFYCPNCDLYENFFIWNNK